MDVCEATKKVLSLNGWDAELKRLDQFTGHEGICLRRVVPETARSYMDVTRTVLAQVVVYVVNRSERTAMETCDAIAAYLSDRPVPSLDGSYRWTATRIYTEPQELVLDDGGFYTWVTRVEIEAEL